MLQAKKLARALVNGRADGAAERCQVTRDAGQVGKGFINAVDLKRRDHGFDDGHDALAHVAVQRVVAAERDDAVTAQVVFDLKIRRAHLHEGLGIVAARDYAAVVVSE